MNDKGTKDSLVKYKFATESLLGHCNSRELYVFLGSTVRFYFQGQPSWKGARDNKDAMEQKVSTLTALNGENLSVQMPRAWKKTLWV